MTYTVNTEIEKIAEIKGISIEEVLKTTKAEVKKLSVGYTVCNKANLIQLQGELKDAQAEARKEAIRKERLEGYRWIKEEGEWVVAGDFADKKVGDEITVTKANGERQVKRIYLMTSCGNARVE